MQNQRLLVENQTRARGCLCALATGMRALLDWLCPPSPGTPGTQGNQRRVISFLPGTISILTEHAPELRGAQLARAVAADLSSRGLSQQLVVPERGDRTVVTFPTAANGRALSIVRTVVPGARPASSRLVPTLVNELNRQLRPVPPVRTGGEQPQPSPTFTDTPQQAVRAMAADAQAPAGVRLVVASPEWLSTGSPTAKGGGGPGGRPVGVPPSRAAQPAWRPTFVADGANPQSSGVEGSGAGVIVAVLDTLQPEQLLDRAYSELVANPPAGVAHPVLAGLWGRPRKLILHQAGASHLLQEVDCSLLDHDYLMPDHGLFAAGLIHGVAPEAEIHLIEVLNPYGVGSLASIAEGFRQVLELRRANPNRPIVVNLSLVLTMPQPDKNMLAYLAKSDPPLGAFTPQEIEQTSYLLQQLCYLLLDAHIAIVAAAGNDADDPGIDEALDRQRPDARFPAAYEGIIGVGALNYDETPAVYSNRSDRPLSAGLAVWGGDKAAASDETDGRNGLAGIFLSTSFPDGQLNGDGWARWSGTSFATPVIAGALAAILGQTPQPPDPIAILRGLSTRNEPQIGEIVPMQQRP